jgi:hypothetical protein
MYRYVLTHLYQLKKNNMFNQKELFQTNPGLPSEEPCPHQKPRDFPNVQEVWRSMHS